MPKYLENGQEVNVITQFEGGFVVEPLLERDDDVFWGDPRIVKKAYDDPPTFRINQEVVELEAKKLELKKDIGTLKVELASAKEERARLLELLAQVPALRRIEDFIAGRFTHLVTEAYGRFKLFAKESPEFVARHGNKQFKLLTLFGDTAGNLSWRLNEYKDGTGCNEFCYPCFSEEEGREIIARRIEELTKSPDHRSGVHFDNFEESLKKHGLPVPALITEMLGRKRYENAVAAKAKAEASLQEASKLLESLPPVEIK